MKVYTIVAHPDYPALYIEYEYEDQFWVELNHTKESYKAQGKSDSLFYLLPKPLEQLANKKEEWPPVL